MKPLRGASLFLCAALLLLLLAGCGPKAAGTWQLTDQSSGGGSLTLNKDGTGTMNMPPSPSGPIKWTEDGNAIKIFNSTDDTSSATPLITGTLSDDKKSLTLSIGSSAMAITTTLTRQ